MAGKGNKKRGKSGGARGGAGRRSSGGGARRPAPARDPFAINGLVRAVFRDARELLTVDDPLEAEDWASAVLGMTYKAPLPPEVAEKYERAVGPAIVSAAERRRDATGLVVLCALAAVTGDEIGAREAAARMAAHGVPRPRWADAAGRPEFLGGYSATDPFGDQISYHLLFQYEGFSPHMIMALYDENLGGIIKDAFVGDVQDDTDVRAMIEAGPELIVSDVVAAEAAAHIIEALATGDLYIDNDWTEDFRHTRLLLLSRVRLLAGAGQTAPAPEPPEPEEPLDDAAREALVEEFFASPPGAAFASLRGPARDDVLTIVDQCLTARCDFGDGDPLRWSPIVAELFLLDYLPRKVDLSQAEIDALPAVLTAWVRFALAKRGLAEELIGEATDAVSELTDEFREAMGDGANYGPARAIIRALKADGVDLTDQTAVDAWFADFNARPDEERYEIIGPPPDA